MPKNPNSERAHPRVGDIFEIALPNNRFACGKVFCDASVGIYEKIFAFPAEPPSASPFAFIVGLYDDILKSGAWPIIAHEPFRSTEDEWPPPACIKDMISGDHSVYHKGEIRASTEVECDGLETAAVWDADHVIDRIMGGTKYL